MASGSSFITLSEVKKLWFVLGNIGIMCHLCFFFLISSKAKNTISLSRLGVIHHVIFILVYHLAHSCGRHDV